MIAYFTLGNLYAGSTHILHPGERTDMHELRCLSMLQYRHRGKNSKHRAHSRPQQPPPQPHFFPRSQPSGFQVLTCSLIWFASAGPGEVDCLFGDVSGDVANLSQRPTEFNQTPAKLNFSAFCLVLFSVCRRQGASQGPHQQGLLQTALPPEWWCEEAP
jgi:hypothetical protein